jgi:hypothetical protein
MAIAAPTGRLALALLLAFASLVVAAEHAGAQLTLGFEAVVTGLSSPLGLVNAGDGSGRLFILEQTGRIKIYDGTQVLATPFLDVSSLITCCGERGLLGLAFHPDYATNGLFYVHYTNTAGNTALARYRVSSNPNVADAASGQVMLNVTQPFTNHKGGQLAFGPDRFLYVGLGDGGSGGDPDNRAQNLSTPSARSRFSRSRRPRSRSPGHQDLERRGLRVGLDRRGDSALGRARGDERDSRRDDVRVAQDPSMTEPFRHQHLAPPPRSSERRAVLPRDLRVAAVVDHQHRRRQRRRELERVEDRPGSADTLLDHTMHALSDVAGKAERLAEAKRRRREVGGGPDENDRAGVEAVPQGAHGGRRPDRVRDQRGERPT